MSEVPFADTTRWMSDPVKETYWSDVGPGDDLTHPCGLDPIEFNVIIDQDPVEETTKGGLILIDQEKQKHQTTRGSIVAVSPLAFTYEEWPDGARKPAVGDRVAFAQHTGAFIDGQDGKKYRVVKDKDILAVLR